MKPSDYKRVKHGQMPGDIPKADKIDMREGRNRRPGVHGWLRTLYAKTRAVLKRRTQVEITAQQADVDAEIKFQFTPAVSVLLVTMPDGSAYEAELTLVVTNVIDVGGRNPDGSHKVEIRAGVQASSKAVRK